MKIKKTKFKGLMIVNGIKHQDKRGYLRELILEKLIKRKFKFQILSVSKKNVLRGLHFQVRKPQGKLISVLKGEIFDVAVDLRKNSKTYGKYFSIKLSEKNCTSVFSIRRQNYCRLLISQDVGKMGFRQISLNIYILYQK